MPASCITLPHDVAINKHYMDITIKDNTSKYSMEELLKITINHALSLCGF